MQEKVLRLDECMEGVSAETVQHLMTYMYSHDSLSFISSLSYEHLEKAAVLADIWAMSRFLELCGAVLHGRALPSCSMPAHGNLPFSPCIILQVDRPCTGLPADLHMPS